MVLMGEPPLDAWDSPSPFCECLTVDSSEVSILLGVIYGHAFFQDGLIMILFLFCCVR